MKISMILEKNRAPSENVFRKGLVGTASVVPRLLARGLAKPQRLRDVPIVSVCLQLIVEPVGVLLEGHCDVGQPLLANPLGEPSRTASGRRSPATESA